MSVSLLPVLILFSAILCVIITSCENNAEGNSIPKQQENETVSPAEDFEYELREGICVIKKYVGTDIEVIIPDSIKDRPVTKIDQFAFEDYDMKRVVIPDSVLDIDTKAFVSCSQLTQVKMSANLKKLGSAAFAYCEELEELELPTSLTEISGIYKIVENPADPFYRCDKLTLIVSSGSYAETYVKEYWKNYAVKTDSSQAENQTSLEQVKDTPSKMFEYYLDQEESDGGIHILKYVGQDKTVKIPERIDGQRVVYIGMNAFKQNVRIKKIFIPDAVYLEDYAFSECENVEEIAFEGKVLNQSMRGVFSSCKSLKEIKLPSGVQSLSDDVFKNCTSLERVIFQENLKYIESDSVFNNCTALKQVEFPSSLEKIGKKIRMMDYNTGIETIKWNEVNIFTSCEDVSLIVHDGSYAESYAKKNGLIYEIK